MSLTSNESLPVKLLNEHAVAELTGLSVASSTRWRVSRTRPSGLTHGSAVLYRAAGLPEEMISNTIERLLKIGLLEISGKNPRRKSKLRSQRNAARPQQGAGKSQHGAAEGNGTEHHHQERKRQRKNGTERARDELATKE